MLRRVPPRLGLVAGLIILIGLSGCAYDWKPREPLAGELWWNGDVETGDLSQFKDTPWNVAGGALPPTVVSDPALVRQGKYAVAMTIPGTRKRKGICCGSRSEIEPNIEKIQAGDELYFGFSTLLGEGFPIKSDWQTITQWKNEGEGSPPLELGVGAGKYQVSGGFGHPDGPEHFRKPIGRAVTGQWVDWVFHVKFSPDPDIGYVEIWQGNELVLPRFHPASGTMYPNPDGEATSYLKTGYYRDGYISTPGTIYFDNWRVGSSRNIVAYPHH